MTSNLFNINEAQQLQTRMSNLLKLFDDKNVLLILDNCDKLLTEDYDSFKNFIVNLLNKEQDLKIMVTSKMAISDSVNINE
jgi:predicted ATPase